MDFQSQLDIRAGRDQHLRLPARGLGSESLEVHGPRRAGPARVCRACEGHPLLFPACPLVFQGLCQKPVFLFCTFKIPVNCTFSEFLPFGKDPKEGFPLSGATPQAGTSFQPLPCRPEQPQSLCAGGARLRPIQDSWCLGEQCRSVWETERAPLEVVL